MHGTRGVGTTSDRLIAEGEDMSGEGGGLLARLFEASALPQVTGSADLAACEAI